MEHGARLVQATVGVSAQGGNAVTVLRNGDEIFPAMLEAIRAAERSVLLSTYVYWTGDIAVQVAESLAERAAAGVDVKVLVDWFGGRLMANELIQQMEDAGVEFAWFRPPGRIASAVLSLDEGLVGQHRTHRKVLVCDGRVAFTGGVGIAEEWTGDARGPDEWRDTHLRIVGPVAASLVSAFGTNWHEAHGSPLPMDTVPPPEHHGSVPIQVVRGQPGRFVSDVALLLRALLDATEERLWVETAYFVPDAEFTARLIAAVDRGVDVRIVVPGPHVDKRVSQIAARESFDELLEAGVELYEFQPTMLHTKVSVFDDVAVSGSANLNMRSFSQDDEVVVVLHDAGLAQSLGEDVLADIGRSERIQPGRFHDRSRWHRAQEQAVRVIRRFM